MSGKVTVPHFATESDEADWWYANRQEHDLVMGEALKAGSTVNLEKLLNRNKSRSAMAVEVDLEDLAKARAQAVKRGVQDEDYIRQLLHEALLTNDSASRLRVSRVS